MSERSIKLLIEDILESANKIIKYTHLLNFDDFVNNDIVSNDDKISNFNIIGEASNRLPDEIKNQFASVDWYSIRGFRNRIVHDYMSINYKIVGTLKRIFFHH